jgi:hypothetical protein
MTSISRRQVADRLERVGRVTTLVLVAVSFTGCEKAREATYPVHGKVTFTDGTPMNGGSISFRSVDRQPSINAHGVIEPDGTFELSTFAAGDGAIAGRHRAVVVTPSVSERARQPVPRPIHPKYRQYETSGLEFTVTTDPTQNQFAIELTPSEK